MQCVETKNRKVHNATLHYAIAINVNIETTENPEKTNSNYLPSSRNTQTNHENILKNAIK
jgi:hypothetical protein